MVLPGRLAQTPPPIPHLDRGTAGTKQTAGHLLRCMSGGQNPLACRAHGHWHRPQIPPGHRPSGRASHDRNAKWTSGCPKPAWPQKIPPRPHPRHSGNGAECRADRPRENPDAQTGRPPRRATPSTPRGGRRRGGGERPHSYQRNGVRAWARIGAKFALRCSSSTPRSSGRFPR